MVITDRRKVEEALRESEHKLKILFEILPVGVSVLDADGHITFMNPVLEKILDITHAGLLRGDYRRRTYLRGDGTLMPETEFASAVAIREQRAVHNVEIGVQLEDGRVIWTSVSAVPVAFGNWRVVIVTTDITGRKQMEAQAAQLAAIVQSSDDIIIGKTLDGIITSWNAGAERAYGYAEGEMLGKSIACLVPPGRADEMLQILERIRAGSRVDHLETVRQRKDGQPIHVSLTISPVKDAAGHIIGVSTIGRDITEHKKAEDRIKALLEEKEVLLKEVHHRIKNNMSSMMSLLSLQSNALKNPEAVAALLEAKGRMRSMGVLYDKLYRSENLREMSLKDYLPALIDEIVGVFPNKDTVKIEKEIDDIVVGVKVLSPLGIIVNELITNVMKHAFAGREDGSISVTASATNDRVTIVIEDNGNGIPESVDIANSNGFGLQLVSMLTAQLDGTIRIERGKGARFVLEFDA